MRKSEDVHMEVAENHYTHLFDPLVGLYHHLGVKCHFYCTSRCPSGETRFVPKPGLETKESALGNGEGCRSTLMPKGVLVLLYILLSWNVASGVKGQSAVTLD